MQSGLAGVLELTERIGGTSGFQGYRIDEGGWGRDGDEHSKVGRYTPNRALEPALCVVLRLTEISTTWLPHDTSPRLPISLLPRYSCQILRGLFSTYNPLESMLKAWSASPSVSADKAAQIVICTAAQPIRWSRGSTIHPPASPWVLYPYQYPANPNSANIIHHMERTLARHAADVRGHEVSLLFVSDCAFRYHPIPCSQLGEPSRRQADAHCDPRRLHPRTPALNVTSVLSRADNIRAYKALRCELQSLSPPSPHCHNTEQLQHVRQYELPRRDLLLPGTLGEPPPGPH